MLTEEELAEILIDKIVLRARIAELEAALKPFADVAWFLDKHADYETMTVDGEYIRAARAAYLGEKE